MTKTLFLLPVFLLISAMLGAQEKQDSVNQLLEEIRTMDSVEKSLHYQTGKIELQGGIATINVPAGFKFLGPADAKHVVENIWGNPPAEQPLLGLIFPANSGATDPGSYAFVVQYENLGYVKDDDADKIDYDDLLKELKKGSEKDNLERRKAGLMTMDLMGWAAKPYYDKNKKVLYWAKEYSVPGREDHTLNYDVRILGRKGVLTLQAVSQMNELDSVNSHINDVLGMVSFNEGNRYSDFDSKTDDVAAWTIGGLVAGKVLAKVGFFAIILKSIKFIIAGIVLVGGAIWRFITGRKKNKEDLAYQPQPTTDHSQQTDIPA